MWGLGSNAVDRWSCPRMNGHTSDRVLRIFGHTEHGLPRINGHTTMPQSLCWCGFPGSTGSSFLYLMLIVVGSARWITRNTDAATSTEEDRARAFDRGCGSQKVDAVTGLIKLDRLGCRPSSSVVAQGRGGGGGGVFGGWQETCLGSKGVELFGGPNNFDLRRPR